MDTPEPTKRVKTVRVSHDTWSRLGKLAERLNGSADDAIRFLLNRDMVRIPLTPERRERWERSAKEAGFPLDEHVAAVMESAVMYGTDRGTMAELLSAVQEIRGRLRRIDARLHPSTEPESRRIPPYTPPVQR